jgi:hypothetical protein
VTGPGTIVETNGNIRQLRNNEGLAIRTQANKYMELISTIIDYLGLGSFFQKYVDFVANLQLPKLF